jgi:HSP20 family protein
VSHDEDGKSGGPDVSFGGSLGGAFRGLVDIVEKLGELAESGEGSWEGTIGGGEGGGESSGGVRGVWGLRVRSMGGGGEGGSRGPGGVEVEPFGDVRERDDGSVVVEEVREPMVDVFAEEDGVHLVAEMPGVGAGDIEWSIEGDVMSLEAGRDAHRYRKELLLPRAFERPVVEVRANNGVIELRCREAAPDEASDGASDGASERESSGASGGESS